MYILIICIFLACNGIYGRIGTVVHSHNLNIDRKYTKKIYNTYIQITFLSGIDLIARIFVSIKLAMNINIFSAFECWLANLFHLNCLYKNEIRMVITITIDFMTTIHLLNGFSGEIVSSIKFSNFSVCFTKKSEKFVKTIAFEKL